MNDRRAQLLAATCAVIARHGVRGLRVDDVAREAGASTALIYYYFRDRSGLVSSALTFVNDRAGEYVRGTDHASGRESLVAQLIGEFQDLAEVRENSAVWGEIRSAAVFDTGLQPQVARATEVWSDEVASTIEAGQHDGSIDATVNPRDGATRLTCLVEGLSNRWLSQQISTEQARALLHTAITREIGHLPSTSRARTRRRNGE